MGWVERQVDLQEAAGNHLPLTGEELSQYVRTMSLALIKEIGEALDHISWKTWTVDEPWLERTKYLEELADAQIFLGNLVAAVGASTAEFSDMVEMKQDVVLERFRSKRYKQRRI